MDLERHRKIIYSHGSLRFSGTCVVFVFKFSPVKGGEQDFGRRESEVVQRG